MNREQAIERVKARIHKLASGADLVDMEALLILIPELKESESERYERVRQRLIEYFHGFLEQYKACYAYGGHAEWEGLDAKDILAFLDQAAKEPAPMDDHIDPECVCATRFTDESPGRPPYVYEVVEAWPDGYFVWMIGRHGFPHPGYLPLAQEASEKYHILTDTLKALYVGDEGLCEYIAREGHRHEKVTWSVFQKMKREYEQKTRHDDR